VIKPDKLLRELHPLETFGSRTCTGKVTVDPRKRAVFTVHPMIVPGN